MSYKRKYKRGDKIKSFDELVKQDFIYFIDKITHKGWFLNWQVRFTQMYIERGMLYYAIKIDDDKKYFFKKESEIQ